jgi:hypothetical protein
MKAPAKAFIGEVEVESLAGEYPPYILSVRFTPEAGAAFIRYYTIDDPVDLPVSENALLARYVIPRL